MAKIVYFSVTGQTRRFVNKIPIAEKIEITPHNPFIEVGEPFILVVPTYVAELLEPVYDFLETGRNQTNCVGTFGGGNRNFANLFCFTVHDLEAEYGIPILHTFEFQGSATDVEKLEKELDTIENANRSTEKSSQLL